MEKSGKRNKGILILGMTLALSMMLSGCGGKENPTDGNLEQSGVLEETTNQENEANLEKEQGETEMSYEQQFKDVDLAESYKNAWNTNPIMVQRFGADPYAMVYGDRVYFYMTADEFEYDAAGNIIENSYQKINTINVVSTDDMINFTDHGSIKVAGKDGIAKWARNSWAPAAAWKTIDGKDKFFLYFADSGSGIGVIVGDSPVGPFEDPLGKGLIRRDMENCGNVLWLFDPAVLVDDDGKAYIYFGGGVPQDKISHPGTARVAQLGEDMTSIVGDVVAIDAPYLFEDSGIHKYNNKYYYTYCSNWQVDAAGTAEYGFYNAEIVSMESDSPMGPFTFKEVILQNPGKYCGLYGNNHHAVFEFKDQWYIAYHTRALEKSMGVEHGYRATSVDTFTMGEDGTIGYIKQTTDGRTQLKNVDAYATNRFVTVASMAGMGVVPANETAETYGSGDMLLSQINDGDWLRVAGVDFGETPATKLQVSYRNLEGKSGLIQIRTDRLYGDVIGYVAIEAEKTGGMATLEVVLEKEVTGVHDLFFAFIGEGYEMENYSFVK